MITTGYFLGALLPRDNSTETRARIDTLSQELITDRHADLGEALRSDFSQVSVAAHELRTYRAHAASLLQAETWGQGLQTALGGMQDDLQRLFEAIPASLTGTGDMDLAGIGEIGSGVLSDLLSQLDARVGGRGLFQNGHPGASPPPDAQTVMADIAALAGGATDLVGLTAAVDAYFAPGGPYGLAAATLPADPVAFPTGPAETAAFQISAASPEIVTALQKAALAAALPDAGFPMSETDREAARSSLIEGIATATSGLTGLRGRIGAVEARISDIADRLDSARARQETALGDATAPDPNETATRLQAEMSRLETTYAITARRSRLRLTDFIR
ncbi:MAG: hypothetical protein AAF390_01610 [Pseudomonadota bacterium]